LNGYDVDVRDGLLPLHGKLPTKASLIFGLFREEVDFDQTESTQK